MLKHRRTISGITFCLYMTAVLVLCLIKTDGLPEVEKSFFGIPFDKVAHFMMFLPFPILSGLTFIPKDSGIQIRLATMAVLTIAGAGMAYGTEQLQAMTDYRSCDMKDFIADILGIVSGTLISISTILLKKHSGRK